MASNATLNAKSSLASGALMMTLYQMFAQAVELVDPNVMRAKIEEFEREFEQKYGRKMSDDELAMLKTAKEIVERELWAEKHRKKAA